MMREQIIVLLGHFIARWLFTYHQV